MTEWITDRQPTKEDEDKGGEVRMMRFPDGSESSIGMTDALVAAAHVGPGVPWKHTDDWETFATPEPEPEAPKPEPKPKLRVGQVWRSRLGEVVTIKSYYPDPYFPFHGTNNERYTLDGRFYYLGTDPRDLVELITDTPAEAPQPQPEPAPTTRKVPRLFAGPIRRIFMPSGSMLMDAIADDGTAWFWREGEAPAPSWRQIPPLPEREELIDA